jgi:outer membrane protein OmpA-like peptidoglycan-associated protein
MQRSKTGWIAAACVLMLALPILGQASPTARADLEAAEAAVRAAELAGAPIYARELYEQAQARLTLARTNINSTRRGESETARLRAIEAMRAAQLAEERARLISMGTEARNLVADIQRFGGTAPAIEVMEPMAVPLERTGDSRARVKVAEQAIVNARAVGAESVAADMLRQAEQNLNTARRILRNQRNSESADHLAFVAEMQARRAETMALSAQPDRLLPGLRLERTRLAQAAADAEAAAERQRRGQLEREAADLRARLDAEQASRRTQSQQLEQLRSEIAERDRQMQMQFEQDRRARVDAEARLDEMRRNYDATLARTGTSPEVEALRRQLEDQQIALQNIRDREVRSEEAMRAEISRLQAELNTQRQTSEQASRQAELQARQQELDRIRMEREESARRLAAVEATSAQVQQRLAATEEELQRTRAELARKEEAERMQSQLNAIAPTRRDERGLIVTLPGLLFDTGRWTLQPGAMNTLDRIADQLKALPNARVVVEGHTDSVGSAQSNMTLSERRANSVRDHLVSRGIASDRITAIGRGQDVPVASNTTAAGRQQNRRVELIISE